MDMPKNGQSGRSGLMEVYAQVAAHWGQVDPNDDVGVQRFFEQVFPTLSAQLQQEVVDDVFARSLNLPPRERFGHGD